jgi:hypothetical protein
MNSPATNQSRALGMTEGLAMAFDDLLRVVAALRRVFSTQFF